MAKTIKYLTPMRGLAALMIFFFHLQFWFWNWHVEINEVTAWLSRGYIWVDFFFVLSGFILTHVYGDWFKDGISGSQYADFLESRFARIYPLYIATLLTYVFLNQTVDWLSVSYDAYFNYPERFTASGFISSVFLVQSLGLHDNLVWNYPAWSISVEFVVYLLFPLIIMAAQNRLYRVMLPVVSLVIFIAAYRQKGNIDMTYDFGIVRCFFEFVIGVYLYKFCYHRKITWFEKSCMPAIGLFVLTISLLHFKPEVVADYWFIPLFSLLTLALAKYQGNKLTFLDSKLAVGIGNISYSFYLWHFIVIDIAWMLYCPELVNRGKWHPNILEGLIFTGVMLGALILISYLSYLYIEKPARNFIKSRIFILDGGGIVESTQVPQSS